MTSSATLFRMNATGARRRSLKAAAFMGSLAGRGALIGRNLRVSPTARSPFAMGARALGASHDLATAASSAPAGGFDTDLLVVGCGIAGSAAALQAARHGMQVTMLSSAPNKDDCNSFWAQGGIIYKAEDDSPELLASDVHTAGAGLCNDAAVMKLALEGPPRVEEVLLRGAAKVPFDLDPEGNLALCLEASHNRARIIHWRDETGKAITTSVQAAAAQHPNIRLLTATTALDLALAGGQCVGAHVLIQEDRINSADGNIGLRVETVRSPATVLATGGLGDIYAHTSNPASARGAGFAMALRAGAFLSGMEYVQFHPTTLYMPGKRSFLLTEALRGVGARLVDRHGRCFAKDYHPDGELAPRDIVSRTILSEMRAQNAAHMYLDISHRPADWIRGRFPSIYEHCLQLGYDMTVQPLPVVPAAHYFCGGVTTDLEGRTSVPGLFAAGEVACTGLHGANRLASTSLLEGLVWGCSIADHLADSSMQDSRNGLAASADLHAILRPNVPGEGVPLAHPEAVDSAWKNIRNTLWEHVGVVRRTSGLQDAAQRLSHLARYSGHLYKSHALSLDTVELRNGAQTGALVAMAAANNPCSVGTHFLEDCEDDADHHHEAQGQAQG